MAPSTKRKSDYVSDQFVASDNSDAGKPAKRNKPCATSFQPSAIPQVDSDGNKYWEISKARRVTISEFKGKFMVNVREYYEKDGDWLPGKKGISMTVEQYSALINIMPQIENTLQEKGESVPRPDYSGASAAGAGGVASNGEEAEGLKKPNIETTSDEEE